QHPCVGPERADFVLPGCAIFDAIRRMWPAPRVTVADRGLREGMLLRMMRAERARTGRFSSPCAAAGSTATGMKGGSGKSAAPPPRGQAVTLRTARGRSTASQRWLKRQLNDPYVQAAHNQGWRSRAAFKLI